MTIKVTKSTPHSEELRAALQRAADLRERYAQEDADAAELERMFSRRPAPPVYVTVIPERKVITQKAPSRTANVTMLAISVLMLILSLAVYIGFGPCIPVTVLASISAVFGIAGGIA